MADDTAGPNMQETPQTRTCTGCDVARVMTMFKQKPCGALFKTCVKCHEKTARLKDKKAEYRKQWLPKKLKEDPDYTKRHSKAYFDRMRENNPEELREQKRRYYEKKLKEDAEGFRAHQAKGQRARRLANVDVHRARDRERSKTCVKRRISMMKSAAKGRGYAWEVDTERVARMITGPCFFCGVLPSDTLHSLDRLDNANGYILNNYVGCCGVCNNMKMCLDAHTFLRRCLHISSLETHNDAWPDTKPSAFFEYRASAKQKKRVFEMTKARYEQLTAMPCTFCVRAITATNTSGIDRIDNDLGYVEGNMQPGCTECNRMRGSLTVEIFKEKAAMIAARADLLDIPEMPVCLRVVTRRKK